MYRIEIYKDGESRGVVECEAFILLDSKIQENVEKNHEAHVVWESETVSQVTSMAVALWKAQPMFVELLQLVSKSWDNITKESDKKIWTK